MSALSPIMHLAEALAYFFGREQALDEEELGRLSDAYKNELIEKKNANLRAIEGIEHALSSIRAEKLSEAAVQIMIAAARVRALRDELDSEPVITDALATIDALLYSALPALEQLTEPEFKRYNPARYGFRSPLRPETQKPESE